MPPPDVEWEALAKDVVVIRTPEAARRVLVVLMAHPEAYRSGPSIAVGLASLPPFPQSPPCPTGVVWFFYATHLSSHLANQSF